MRTFGTENWRVNLPDEWLGQHMAEYSTVYDPKGVGALQISVVKETNKMDDELKEFASECFEDRKNLEQVTLRNFSGFSFGFCVGDEYWRQWLLKSGNFTMFVTYNCALDDKGIEDSTISSILETLVRA